MLPAFSLLRTKSRFSSSGGVERKLIIRVWALRVSKETRMSSGTIKRLVRDRGFGFIRDDGGQEWFFHRSSVQGSFDQLNEGQRVQFEEEPSAKGPRAGNVRSEG
jgi:cold shock protein